MRKVAIAILATMFVGMIPLNAEAVKPEKRVFVRTPQTNKEAVACCTCTREGGIIVCRGPAGGNHCCSVN